MAFRPLVLSPAGRLIQLPPGGKLTTDEKLTHVLTNQAVIITALARLLEEQGLVLEAVLEESDLF